MKCGLVDFQRLAWLFSGQNRRSRGFVLLASLQLCAFALNSELGVGVLAAMSALQLLFVVLRPFSGCSMLDVG
jgi:hypothetical protein